MNTEHNTTGTHANNTNETNLNRSGGTNATTQQHQQPPQHHHGSDDRNFVDCLQKITTIKVRMIEK